MVDHNNSIEKFLGQFTPTYQASIKGVLSLISAIPLSQLKEDITLELDAIVRNFGDESEPEYTTIVESIVSQEDIRNTLQEVQQADDARWKKIELRQPQKSISGKYEFGYLAYQDFFPSEIRYFQSGSELLSDLARRELARKLPKTISDTMVKIKRPKLSEFKRIHLILVTDNIGSGNQAITFLYSMLAGIIHVKSPESPLAVTVLTWGATRRAIEALNDEIRLLKASTSSYKSVIFKFIYLNYINSLHDLDDRSFIETFKAEAKAMKSSLKPSQILGYDSTATLTVFEGMGCPNTIPGVFFNNAVCRNPLFTRKLVYSGFSSELSNLRKSFEEFAPKYRDHEFELFRRRGLSGIRKIALHSKSPIWQLLINAAVGISLPVSRAMIRATQAALIDAERNLVDHGWIDSSGRITEAGSDALSTFGQQNRGILSPARFTRRKKFEINQAEYYPQYIGGVS